MPSLAIPQTRLLHSFRGTTAGARLGASVSLSGGTSLRRVPQHREDSPRHCWRLYSNPMSNDWFAGLVIISTLLGIAGIAFDRRRRGRALLIQELLLAFGLLVVGVSFLTGFRPPSRRSPNQEDHGNSLTVESYEIGNTRLRHWIKQFRKTRQCQVRVTAIQDRA